jgi:hypothetical protein
MARQLVCTSIAVVGTVSRRLAQHHLLDSTQEPAGADQKEEGTVLLKSGEAPLAGQIEYGLARGSVLFFCASTFLPEKAGTSTSNAPCCQLSERIGYNLRWC